MELRAYPHLQDVHRDDDLFGIFMMIPQWSLLGIAQLGLHFSTLKCHHAFLPRDAPLIYGPDSVADMDDLSSFDFPTYHIFDAILGHIPHFGRDL